MTAIIEKVDAFEWLGRELRAKTAQYEVSVRETGERPPNWQEKAGVFATMDDQLQKDLAFLLAYGDYKEHSTPYRNVLKHLTESILAVADQEKTRNKEKRAVLCRSIANMELYFFLHQHLDAKFTNEGRLWFAGVDKLVSWDNYRNNWKHYGDAIRIMLDEAKINSQNYIYIYRRKLK